MYVYMYTYVYIERERVQLLTLFTDRLKLSYGACGCLCTRSAVVGTLDARLSLLRV